MSQINMLHNYTEHPSQEEEMNITADSLGRTCLEPKDYKKALGTGSKAALPHTCRGPKFKNAWKQQSRMLVRQTS